MLLLHLALAKERQNQQHCPTHGTPCPPFQQVTNRPEVQGITEPVLLPLACTSASSSVELHHPLGWTQEYFGAELHLVWPATLPALLWHQIGPANQGGASELQHMVRSPISEIK